MSTFHELTPPLSPRNPRDLLNPGPEFEQLLGHSGCYCFAYDYRADRFHYVSSSIRRLLGYDHRAWKIGGQEALLRVIHPDDRESLGVIHETIRRVLCDTPADTRSELSFVYPLRLITADGRILYLSHHLALFQLAEDGSPLSSFTVVTDITPFHRHPECRLYVRRRTPQGEIPIRCIPISAGPPAEFTPREREVLTLVASGFSSREIASELFISYNTVCTHRKNLLRKADAGSTVELLDVARDLGLVG